MDDQLPKYSLLLNLKEKIHWVTGKEKQEFKLEAFGFSYGTKYKDFHAQHQDLEIMRQIIACRINFSKIADFYCPEFNIGQGNSATVYQCKTVSNNELFAIKAINKQNLQTSQQIISFENEVSIMRQLTQIQASGQQFFSNLYEVFEGESTNYLVTELLQGRTLQEEINIHQDQSKLLSNDSIRIIMTRLLKGVQVMHNQKIIHRDLKPENIIFEKIGQYATLKIIDFGLATYKDVDQYLFYKCGTPGFVAPEILNSQNRSYLYSEKCDIFSCGVIFFKLLTGKNLFQAQNMDQTLKLNKLCAIDFKRKQLSHVDEFSQQLLKAMLVEDPQQRISACEALKSSFFTGNNDEPSKSPLNQQINQKFISNIPPKIYAQIQEQVEEHKDYSPFGHLCKAQKSQEQKIYYDKADSKKNELSDSSEIPLNQNQGKSLSKLVRPSLRSRSIGEQDKRVNQQKKSSLNIQTNSNSKNSLTKNSDLLESCDSIINSFYMKNPLSVIVIHQLSLIPEQFQNPQVNNEINLEQTQSVQEQSFIQDQEEEIKQSLL